MTDEEERLLQKLRLECGHGYVIVEGTDRAVCMWCGHWRFGVTPPMIHEIERQQKIVN